jgi:Ca2+:H+ antiporter
MSQVSTIALKNNEIRVVKASMLGSILSNMLLVLGCCFFLGGTRYQEQHFNCTMASTMSSLLAVSSASLAIPTILSDERITASPPGSHADWILLSRLTAVVMLILYLTYLFFQLKTHCSLFDEERQPEEGETDDERKLSSPAALGTLLAVTAFVSVCAHYMVKSIDSFVVSTNISKTFVGLILIPIIGNAAEHATAVVVALKNKMELAIGVAIGSCLQIALFVTPALVLLGWATDRPMDLQFAPFEVAIFFLSVFVVTLIVQDGKSNYLEGVLCLGM